MLQPFAAANPAGDAALELGLLQQIVGRRTEARRTLQLVLMADPRIPTRARLPARGARGARARPLRGRQRVLPRCRSRWRRTTRAINTAWGDLFLEKYNNKDAARSFQEALKADPEYGPALLGMARALADENPPQALALRASARSS